MKVFISWSGEISHGFAIALAEWLPNVIQAIQPFISSEDIQKGARWFTEVSNELDQANFGILCVTPDNKNAPWLLFEAGALAKKVMQSHVCPILLGISSAQLEGPLAQFQCTSANRDDILKLINSINSALGEKSLSENRLRTSFDKYWNELDAAAKKASRVITDQHKVTGTVNKRSSDDMLEELLNVTRGLGRQLEEIRTDALNQIPPFAVDRFSSTPTVEQAKQEFLREAIRTVQRKTQHPAARGIGGLLGAAEERDEALPIKPIGGAIDSEQKKKDG